MINKNLKIDVEFLKSEGEKDVDSILKESNMSKQELGVANYDNLVRGFLLGYTKAMKNLMIQNRKN